MEKRLPRKIDDFDVVNDDMSRYLQARADKESALARAANLELDVAEGHLVIRDDVNRAVVESATQLKDKIDGLWIRLAPELAQLSDIPSIQALLKQNYDKCMREYLDQLNTRLDTKN